MNIVSPVSGSISNHKSFKWDVEFLWSEFSLEVILINLPRKVWYIDSSVTLSRDKELVSLELWEFVIE